MELSKHKAQERARENRKGRQAKQAYLSSIAFVNYDACYAKYKTFFTFRNLF